MIDKIEEIRARHSRDDRWRNTLPQMHEDRATLLAEVDRLRAEIERLRAVLKNIAALDPDVPDALVADALRGIVAQMGEIARKALEVKP